MSTKLLNTFIDDAHTAKTSTEVLAALHAFVQQAIPLPLAAFGAAYVPPSSDWRFAQLNKEAFVHPSVPQGWWQEYEARRAQEFDPMMMLGRASLMTSTWTERLKTLDPIGVDRWPVELAHKYGIFDLLGCSVSRRWMIGFWSPRVFGTKLTTEHRIRLYAVAGHAALRLESLLDIKPINGEALRPLSQRELSVLRLVSLGHQTEDIAELLGLGAETVRSHVKHVQAKLGAKNRSHAVAEAIRQHLIP